MPERVLTPSEKRTLVAIFNQHWENVRHIKNERLSFTNIYCLVTAGILSLLNSAKGVGDGFLEFSLLLFLLVFSLIGLLTVMRLKEELEHCLRQIEVIVARTGLEEFMPSTDRHGWQLRYPRFRWLFPAFFAVALAGFTALLGWRLLTRHF